MDSGRMQVRPRHDYLIERVVRRFDTSAIRRRDLRALSTAAVFNTAGMNGEIVVLG